MVVPGRHVRRERAEGVEGRLVAPCQLLLHVLPDEVHGDVARALVHDLHPVLPGDLREIPLYLELRELGLVVRIMNRTRPQPVPQGERDVVGGHDLANLAEMRVGEVLLMMRHAPFREDGSPARDDSRQPVRGEGNEPEKYPGVHREVVDALLALLDQGVAVDLPREILGNPVDLLERLVNRHGSDGHRRVAKNPLAGLVDVFPRGEIHDGIRAPEGGPA